jgi:CheY-like chemotaxis protein
MSALTHDPESCSNSQDEGENEHEDEAIRAVVVNDSPAILKALSTLLEAQGGAQLVGTATDGPHALRRVNELQPELVLTALHLEGLNGLQLTRQIKCRPQPVLRSSTAEGRPVLLSTGHREPDSGRWSTAEGGPPAVIMITADDTPEWRTAARAAGVDAFVSEQHMLTQIPAVLQILFPRLSYKAHASPNNRLQPLRPEDGVQPVLRSSTADGRPVLRSTRRRESDSGR